MSLSSYFLILLKIKSVQSRWTSCFSSIVHLMVNANIVWMDSSTGVIVKIFKLVLWTSPAPIGGDRDAGW